MTDTLTFKILSNVLGGLAIFLFGMKYMSEGMQAIAGDRLRRIIRAITDNRLMACLSGFGATCIVQSSSVTTVMVVGMVSAGLMTLSQAIGVILGADIGTTITAWIVALDVFIKGGVLVFGLPLVGISGFFFLFTKNERVRFSAMMIMGLGMVFFGLDLMKDGVKPLRTMPEFQVWFSKFTPNSLFGVVRCVLVGAILTGIVQSSSATVGITMVLAKDGIINLETAMALVIGENIGTTITAYLASLGTPRNAKRAAYAHIFFKVVGSFWAIPMLWLGMDFLMQMLGPGSLMKTGAVETVGESAMLAIAIFHSGFNILNVALFLPLVRVSARMLEWAFPDKPELQAERLTYLDVGLLATPAIGIQQSHDEVRRMGEQVETMLSLAGNLIQSGAVEDSAAKPILDTEEKLDVWQREIVVFLSKLLAGSVPVEIVQRGRVHLRLADEYESISDYVSRLVKMHRKLSRAGEKLSPESIKEIMDIHERVSRYLAKINQAFSQDNLQLLDHIKEEGMGITEALKSYRDQHLTRFTQEGSTPLASMVFTDTLNAYRRIRGHGLNISQALTGGKQAELS